MVLNLSQNTIENITPLKLLNKIRILDLSGNCLLNVDALNNNTELVNLGLEGNMIKGVDQLRALKTCSSLRNLKLQSLSGGNQNPICQLNNYRRNIFEEIPQIKRLDCNLVNIQLSLKIYNFRMAVKSKQHKKKTSNSISKLLDPSTPTNFQQQEPTFLRLSMSKKV